MAINLSCDCKGGASLTIKVADEGVTVECLDCGELRRFAKRGADE